MRFWRKGLVVLTALVRLLGVVLSLGLWMLAGALRVLATVIGSEDSDDGMQDFPNYYDDGMGIDDFGRSLRPEEEGRPTIRRRV